MPSPSDLDDKNSETKSVNKDTKDYLDESKPSFFQVTMSVLAAALGVQTNANRERDFSQGSPMPYIVGGIIFTVVFVLTLVGVVMLVLPD